MKKSLVLLLILFTAITMVAQPPAKKYSISKGNMVVVLGKALPDNEIDDFIKQYDLGNLQLKSFIRNNFKDSVLQQGWTIMLNDDWLIMIAKPMLSMDNIENPATRLTISEQYHGNFSGNPIPHNLQQFGYNDYKNGKQPVLKDSMVTFVLRKHASAKSAKLAGSFTNWEAGALPMEQTDSGWRATVMLHPGKYHYKFIVNGEWITDPENRIAENDMQGNTNSVYSMVNKWIVLDSFQHAKRIYVAGSFNNWAPDQLKMTKTTKGWEIPVFLAEGTYTYRFVVDGIWMPDPFNADRLPNEFNEYNSVIRIGTPYLFVMPGFKEAQQVNLTGSFNNWRSFELPMQKGDSNWQLQYTLGPGNFEFKFLVDGKNYDASGKQLKDNEPGSIFVINANYTFRLKGYDAAEKVFISGDFNHWSPNSFAMKKDGAEWVLPVHLTKGKHLYKYIIDGKWVIDPDNALWEQNEFDTGNSILWME